MQNFQENHVQLDPNQLKLLEMNGDGPWFLEHDFTQDTEYYKHIHSQTHDLTPPDASSTHPSKRLFYRTSNITISFYNTIYTLDWYAGLEFMQVQGKVINENWHYKQGLYTYMHRMQQSAARGDTDTLKAITLLHNTARNGKKIIIIDAHGETYKAVTGPQLVIVPDKRNPLKTVYVDDLLNDLNEITTDPSYGAIYLTACNQLNAPITKSFLPTVVHTEINRRESAKAKIYWPRN